MSAIKRLLAVLLILLLIVAGVVFAMLNQSQVSLDLFFAMTPPLHLSLLIFAAFSIGMLLGMLITSFTVLRVKVGAARTQRKLRSDRTESGNDSALEANRAQGSVA